MDSSSSALGTALSFLKCAISGGEVLGILVGTCGGAHATNPPPGRVHPSWGGVVDDFFWALPRGAFPLMATYMSMLLIFMRCPITWHKTRLDDTLVWIGWHRNFRLGAVTATETHIQVLSVFWPVSAREDTSSHVQTSKAVRDWPCV